MSLLSLLAAAGGGAPKRYIEDVFSTFLYVGNGTSQTITNGIDILGEGGMVIAKSRDISGSNVVRDTGIGAGNYLLTNTTGQSDVSPGASFTNSGFVLGTGSNTNGAKYASWTFRRAKKFFDIVTYTGDGAASKVISHGLGSVPGCIWVKAVSAAGAWRVYHRGADSTAPQDYLLQLQDVAGRSSSAAWNNTAPTATQFTAGAGNNASGVTYIAYLFAHDAGGFGDAGNENVITCGSYTGDSTLDWSKVINIGYEAQWVLMKCTSTADWIVTDVMRGMSFQTSDPWSLKPNTTDVEQGFGSQVAPHSRGFALKSNNVNINESGQTYVFIAVGRGPARTPESAADVFAIEPATSTNPSWKGGFPVDLAVTKNKTDGSQFYWSTRKTSNQRLMSANQDPEDSNSNYDFDYMTGWGTGYSDANFLSWMFRRAPKFMDVTCFTGTLANQNIDHNLGAVPELMILKTRSASGAWGVYHAGLGADKILYLNLDALVATSTAHWNNTTPTDSVFSVGVSATTNQSTQMIAFLFATLAGISKVGMYTGNGSSQTINCGFSAGARFVMVKRTDAAGHWHFWDTERGIVAGNDSRLIFNLADPEITADDSIDTAASGFVINQVTDSNVNVNGATYIFLAIA